MKGFGTAILLELGMDSSTDSEDGDGMSPAPHRPCRVPLHTPGLASTAGGPVVPSSSLAPSPVPAEGGTAKGELLPLCGVRENEVKQARHWLVTGGCLSSQINLLPTGMSPALLSPCYCKAAATGQVGFNNAITITTRDFSREEALAEQSPAKGGIMHA